MSNLYISDSASGLFPENNEDREVFGNHILHSKRGKASRFFSGVSCLICLFNLETNQSKVHSLGIMNSSFPSVRVVAGDFDNDGQENELAVIQD